MPTTGSRHVPRGATRAGTTTPRRTPWPPAGASRDPGRARWDSRRRGPGRPPAAARAREGICASLLVPASEGDLEATGECPVARIVEAVLSHDRAAHIGIVALVIREGQQVAADDRDRRVGRADPRQHALKARTEAVPQRHLAQLHIARVLHEVVRGIVRGVQVDIVLDRLLELLRLSRLVDVAAARPLVHAL